MSAQAEDRSRSARAGSMNLQMEGKMRRYIVIDLASVLTALVFLGPGAWAGQTSDMGMNPNAQRKDRLEARVEQLNEELNLTREQKFKIAPLLADEIRQIQQVRADTSLPPAEQFAKIRQIRQATNQQIRPLLTAEQQQKLDTMWQNRQAAGEAGRGEGAPGRLQQLAAQLNLTDDQKAKITPILQDEFQQIQQVRVDTSLTRRERFAKMGEIRQNANKQIRPILTPDQQKKLDEMREEARERFGGRGRRGGRNRPMVY